ncbi:MAG: LamG domain-containing protein, partial [Bacteroidia bacterium]
MMVTQKILFLSALILFCSFSKAQISSAGLVAYYPFNGNAGDSSGYGNNGTMYSGVTSTTNRFGLSNNALHFDGTANAYINIPASTSLNTNTMNNVCVSAWFRITSGTTVNNQRSIIQFQDASNINYIVDYNATTAKLEYYNWNGPSSVANINFVTSNTLNTGIWYHLVLRIDSANNTQLYVNNVLWGSSTTTVLKPTNPIFSIGRHPIVTNTWNFYGDMDEIRVYSRYVSNTEIGQLYYQSIYPGLVAYYPFDGNANDSSGFGNNGTVASGTTLTTDRFGQSNKAYNFNGTSNAYISLPQVTQTNSGIMNNELFACWIRPTGTVSGVQARRVLNAAASSGTGYEIIFDYSANKVQVLNWNGPASTTNFLLISKTTLTSGNWYHLAVRMDSANNTNLFINGILDTFTITAVLKPLNTTISIGNNPANGWNFQGDIDDFRVYNRYVSNTEIAQQYSSFTNIYYSKSSGSLDSLSTWGTNADGTGIAPPNFSQNNTGYIVKNNSSPTMSSNWIITGTNTAVIFGDGSNTLNSSIPSGKTFGADSIYVRNNVTFTVLGTLITNKPGFETGSTVQYTSSAAQNILPSSFYNLVVSGGTKSVIANTTVRNTLAMIANINCGSNTLTLGSSTSQIGSLTYGSGIITGNFARWFATTTNSGAASGLFPIGTSSIYRPIQIEYSSAPTTSGILTAMFNSTNPGSSGLNPALNDFSISPIVSVNKAAPNGYWTLTASNGLAGGTYTSTVTATGFYGISNDSALRLLRRSNASSAWSLTGAAVIPTGPNSAPIVKRTGITSIGGDFGIGSDSTINPLPVLLLNFTANK